MRDNTELAEQVPTKRACPHFLDGESNITRQLLADLIAHHFVILLEMFTLLQEAESNKWFPNKKHVMFANNLRQTLDKVIGDIKVFVASPTGLSVSKSKALDILTKLGIASGYIASFKDNVASGKKPAHGRIRECAIKAQASIEVLETCMRSLATTTTSV